MRRIASTASGPLACVFMALAYSWRVHGAGLLANDPQLHPPLPPSPACAREQELESYQSLAELLGPATGLGLQDVQALAGRQHSS